MRYLSAEDVLILHALVIDEYGGSHGVRDTGLLQSIVHKPQATFSGKDLYQDVWAKAAILTEGIVNYHVFVDGNKRTALIVLGRFLALNGYELTATNTDAEKVIVHCATKVLDVPALTQWIKKHAKKIK